MVREMRELYQAGKLDASQSQWFEAPGEERLFDLKSDPFELNNLSRDPDYQLPLQRLRAALDNRLLEIGDLSEESESDMAERFEPGGERFVTSAPNMRLLEGTLHVQAPDAGSSIGYRINGGAWQLYSNPIRITPNDRVDVKAVRYGWEESEMVSWSGGK